MSSDVLVAALLSLVGCGLGAGCGRDQKPAQPEASRAQPRKLKKVADVMSRGVSHPMAARRVPPLAPAPARFTVTVGHGVKLSGTSRNSSTNASRLPPSFAIENKSGRARQVRIVSLTSIGGNQEKQMTVANRGPFELHAKATLNLRVSFTGRPLYNQKWTYRYRLDIAVDGKPLSAVSTTHYICRIPIRRSVP